DPCGEGQERRAARNARHAGSASLAAGADARLGHFRTHRAVVGTRPATRAGDALPGALSPGAAEVHPLRVAGYRQQPPRALLLVDRARPTVLERIAGAVATHVARDQPRSRRHDRELRGTDGWARWRV